MDILISILIAIAIYIIILIAIIRAICDYAAKEISRSFKYDYLATKIAEEICRRMLIIEKQKAKTNNGSPTGTEDRTTPNPS